MAGKIIKTRHRRRKVRIRTYIAVAIAFLVLASIGWLIFKASHSKSAAVWFDIKAQQKSKVLLPTDDAPHQAKIEWWYYNGHLLSESGKKYSFHYTTFLINGLASFVVTHVSFGDHSANKHYIDQQRTAGNPSMSTLASFDFTQGKWVMRGKDGHDTLKVDNERFAFDLDLINKEPPVFHGQQGIIPMDRAGDSYYYSRTRMTISGSIKVSDGSSEKVKGIAWFDHQWGDFSVGQLAWDWFSLQLDDGSDIMIYQLRDKANHPVLNTGTISQHGATEVLDNGAFLLTQENEKWLSPKTGIIYPMSWRIKIPSKHIDIKTHSLVNDSEFDARLTSYNVYWEGAVKVAGSHTGQGFMELSGYSANKP